MNINFSRSFNEIQIYLLNLLYFKNTHKNINKMIYGIK